jgi:menaquinone-dependent protoporphyrinogen IX oxidase
VSCATAIDKKKEAIEKYIRNYVGRFGVEPDLSEAFGPVFDLRRESGLGFFSRNMIKTIAKGLAKDKGIKIKTRGRNDFRSWDDMRDFAKKFAGMLKT